MEPHLEIIHPSGATESFALEGEQVILGRQPKDGIAVPRARELELEHLMLAPRGEGCWLSVVHGARTPALVGGAPFAGGLVPWGTEIQLGSLWLKVVDSAPSTAEAAARLSPVVTLGALGLALALGWVLWEQRAADELPVTTVRPPALFDAAAAPCPEADAKAAGPRAREVAASAAAKSDRYAFAARDGVEAVRLYGLAASCATVAGRQADAAALTAARAALAKQIDEDYRTHVLRLERAIADRRTRQALAESRALVALVGHLDHPYVAWIRSLERVLTSKTAKAAP
jgi:hypothetical protein